MALIQSIHKGRTLKDVTFLDAANDHDDTLIAMALKATGETRSSLFGMSVKRYDEGSAMVTLHTD